MFYQNIHQVKKITHKTYELSDSYATALIVETDQGKIGINLFAKDKDNLKIRKEKK